MTRTVVLPLPSPNYDIQNERVNRRTTEQHIEDIYTLIETIQLRKEKLSSLSERRSQFLLMGAGNV